MGHLASGLAQGMAQGKSAAQEKELNDSLRKAQVKLLDLQLQKEQRSADVMKKLEQQSTPPPLREDNTVAAPMVNAGQPYKPPSLTEQMANLSLPELQSLGVSPADLAKMNSQQQYSQMVQQFMAGQGGQGAQGGGQLGATPPQMGGQQGGLQLSEMTLGPDGPSFKMSDPRTAFMNEGELLGLTRDEMKNIWVKKQQGMDIQGDLEKVKLMQAQIQSQLQLEQLTTARMEREKNAKDEAMQARVDQANVEMDLGKAKEASEIIDRLEGTMLQTGTGSDVRRFGMGLAALVDPSQQQTVADSERFGQIATDFGVKTLEFLLSKGTISDIKFKTMMSNTLNPNNTPSANRQALADILDETISAAEQKQIEIKNLDEVKTLAANLRKQLSPPKGIPVHEWEAMTEAERKLFHSND